MGQVISADLNTNIALTTELPPEIIAVLHSKENRRRVGSASRRTDGSLWTRPSSSIHPLVKDG